MQNSNASDVQPVYHTDVGDISASIEVCAEPLVTTFHTGKDRSPVEDRSLGQFGDMEDLHDGLQRLSSTLEKLAHDSDGHNLGLTGSSVVNVTNSITSLLTEVLSTTSQVPDALTLHFPFKMCLLCPLNQMACCTHNVTRPFLADSRNALQQSRHPRCHACT